MLITGLHSVCDISCTRCHSIVGWTYAKAYEQSQKYKEGKFIVEKINLHMEESSYYSVSHSAGERADKWRIRSMSWGNETMDQSTNTLIYEYYPNTFETIGDVPSVSFKG
jgi:Yippee zinc-binding/DNA-binding /Mis18, centromere assembly